MPKILIPVDGSELSLDAVRHVVQLARHGLQLEVVLAHVQEPASLYEIVATRNPELIATASHEAGVHLMEPALAVLRAAGLPCETEVDVGDVAHTLVDIIERTGCDMVVMGALGQSALRSALLGSVSQQVMQDSPVPVTIVKHPDEVSQFDEEDARTGD